MALYIFESLLRGAIGFTGALSIVIFVWGFAVYIARLGTLRREEGIHIMEWSVGLILTSILLIGILNLFERWIIGY